MKKYKLFLFTTFLFLISAAMAAPQTKAVTFNSPDTPIRVQSSNPEFTLTLQSNPTTGYSWFLVKYDSGMISAVSHKYVAPDSKLMGASGYEVWTFKVSPAAFTVPRTSKVVMQYARPWEKHSGSKSVFKIYTSK